MKRDPKFQLARERWSEFLAYALEGDEAKKDNMSFADAGAVAAVPAVSGSSTDPPMSLSGPMWCHQEGLGGLEPVGEQQGSQQRGRAQTPT